MCIVLLVYQSAQLCHTWSDFSRSLRVMIWETRILFHSILVLLSLTLRKQLTCSVSIVSIIRILVWIFSWHDSFQVTETDASCVLYKFFCQFITFEPVTLCSTYYVWFVTLLASSYAVLLCTGPYLLLVNLIFSLYQNSVWAALTCAKLALRIVIVSFHRWLSLLLRLLLIA